MAVRAGAYLAETLEDLQELVFVENAAIGALPLVQDLTRHRPCYRRRQICSASFFTAQFHPFRDRSATSHLPQLNSTHSSGTGSYAPPALPSAAADVLRNICHNLKQFKFTHPSGTGSFAPPALSQMQCKISHGNFTVNFTRYSGTGSHAPPALRLAAAGLHRIISHEASSTYSSGAAALLTHKGAPLTMAQVQNRTGRPLNDTQQCPEPTRTALHPYWQDPWHSNLHTMGAHWHSQLAEHTTSKLYLMRTARLPHLYLTILHADPTTWHNALRSPPNAPLNGIYEARKLNVCFKACLELEWGEDC